MTIDHHHLRLRPSTYEASVMRQSGRARCRCPGGDRWCAGSEQAAASTRQAGNGVGIAAHLMRRRRRRRARAGRDPQARGSNPSRAAVRARAHARVLRSERRAAQCSRIQVPTSKATRSAHASLRGKRRPLQNDVLENRLYLTRPARQPSKLKIACMGSSCRLQTTARARMHGRRQKRSSTHHLAPYLPATLTSTMKEASI